MNNYVKTMRSMIGKKPLLICGASVIIIRDGQILLQKRRDNGCWSYHGGCLELGERLEDAAKRELLEETGLKANSMKLYGVFSGPELHYIYPNGDEVHNVDTVYICDDFEGELCAEKSEVLELRWFPFNDIPENLNPPISRITREFVKQILEKNNSLSEKLKTNIYFVRHARPDFTIQDDMLRPLSEKGLNDTKHVTKVLEGRNIEAVYSSPFKRAYDTIRDFAEVNGLDINVVEDFRERKVGNVWIDDFENFARKQWEDFGYKLEGGECLREVQERNIEAFYEVLRNNLGKNVAIGTHGTALSTIINYYDHNFGYENFRQIAGKMPWIVCLKFEGMEYVGMEEAEL